MSDITKCPGTDCPIKDNCYRFTVNSSEVWQAYFLEIPGEMKDDKFTCNMYWESNAESVWNQLKDITNGESDS